MNKVLMVGLLALAACSASTENDDDGDPIADRVGDWETSLTPRNNSTVRGTARAQSVGVGTGANISISGAQPGSHHPWHIHAGTCASGGGIMGNANDYPALHVAADGNATANATIGVALNEQSAYHVNVHLSPSALGTIVACGDLDND